MRDVFLSVRAAGLKVGTHYAVRTTRMHGPRKKQLSCNDFSAVRAVRTAAAYRLCRCGPDAVISHTLDVNYTDQFFRPVSRTSLSLFSLLLLRYDTWTEKPSVSLI